MESGEPGAYCRGVASTRTPARWGMYSAQTPHRSLWREGLRRRAVGHTGADPVVDWLVDQANLRGFGGAVNAVASSAPDPSLSLEEIVVGCLTPDALADGRVLKLVVRILQSDVVRLPALLLLARRERAEKVLCWLVMGVPAAERCGAVPGVRQHFEARPPRGYVPVSYAYDFARLNRKAAAAGKLRWKPAPR